MNEIIRRKTRKIFVGNVAIGGGAPISIQSMVSTPPFEIKSTIREILRLQDAGCDIVRVAVPDVESARAISLIKKETKIPIVADIHFDYKLALKAIECGADGLRINPGNIRKKEHLKEIVTACKERNIPIRIGVNSGSINRERFLSVTPQSLVESAWEHIRILEDMGFGNIKVSLKASDVKLMVEANRLFAAQSDYPLHLGVTEAGLIEESIVKSSIGIGVLLLEGIGDTIRVSMTDDVVKEVEVARIILRALGLRKEGIEVISCPTCGRKEFDVEKVAKEIHRRTRGIREYLKVAVMGCVVNGPGEAMDADLGVAFGKTDGVLFKNGKVVRKISKRNIANVILDEIKKEIINQNKIN